MNNDPLDAVDKLKGLTVFTCDRLHGLAPAAIEDCIGCRDARMGGSVLVTQDIHESFYDQRCVRSRQASMTTEQAVLSSAKTTRWLRCAGCRGPSRRSAAE